MTARIGTAEPIQLPGSLAELDGSAVEAPPEGVPGGEELAEGDFAAEFSALLAGQLSARPPETPQSAGLTMWLEIPLLPLAGVEDADVADDRRGQASAAQSLNWMQASGGWNELAVMPAAEDRGHCLAAPIIPVSDATISNPGGGATADSPHTAAPSGKVNITEDARGLPAAEMRIPAAVSLPVFQLEAELRSAAGQGETLGQHPQRVLTSAPQAKQTARVESPRAGVLPHDAPGSAWLEGRSAWSGKVRPDLPISTQNNRFAAETPWSDIVPTDQPMERSGILLTDAAREYSFAERRAGRALRPAAPGSTLRPPLLVTPSGYGKSAAAAVYAPRPIPLPDLMLLPEGEAEGSEAGQPDVSPPVPGGSLRAKQGTPAGLLAEAREPQPAASKPSPDPDEAPTRDAPIKSMPRPDRPAATLAAEPEHHAEPQRTPSDSRAETKDLGFASAVLPVGRRGVEGAESQKITGNRLTAPQAEGLVEMAALRTTPRSSELQLLVHPEHLGRVALRLVERSGVVEVAVRSDSQHLRALLSDGLPALVENLSEKGWDVARAQRSEEGPLGWWSGQQQEQRQSERQQHQEQARRQARSGQPDVVFSLPLEAA